MREGQDPLDFLVMDDTLCGICFGNYVTTVLAEAGRIAMRGAQHSRYRRVARTRVLKHLTAAHREFAERMFPSWVQAHSDKTAPSPSACVPLS